MYCKKCFEKVNENWNYCPKCKNILDNENIEYNNEKVIEIKIKEFKEVLLYILVFFIGLFGLALVRAAQGLFFLVSLISIVTSFIKYPNNKYIKILFWLFLIFTFIYYFYNCIIV